MPNRREVFRLGAIALGNLFALALAVPGVKFLLDPLGKAVGLRASSGRLTRLGQLKVGEPQAFAVIAEPAGRLGPVPRGAGRLGLAGPPARRVERRRSWRSRRSART